MARQPRFDYPGAYHHIMSRGFKRETIFDDAEDYEFYLNCLEYFKGLDYKVLEYSLMPNHTHIEMRTGKVRLQKILKSINNRYAQYKVRKRGLPGPVFQGRPKTILIESAAQAKIVGRYILRNAVKAGLSKRIDGYKWSSYRLIGSKNAPDWYDNSMILAELSENIEEAVRLYKEFIRRPMKTDEKEYPVEVFGGVVAGSKDFYEDILRKFGKDRRKEETQSHIARDIPYEKIIKELLNKERVTIEDLRKQKAERYTEIKRKIAYLLKELCHKESLEVRDYLGISKSALSRYIIDVKTRIEKGERLLEGLIKC